MVIIWVTLLVNNMQSDPPHVGQNVLIATRKMLSLRLFQQVSVSYCCHTEILILKTELKDMLHMNRADEL